MSRRKKKKRSEKRRRVRDSQPRESRQAEVMTVAWMLAMLATLAAEVLGIIVHLLMMTQSVATRLQLLSGTMLVVALVAGVVTLALTPAVLKLRKVVPPRPIVAAACIIGIIPIATTVLILARP